jgi:thiamine biosynthesis lipoprotein
MILPSLAAAGYDRTFDSIAGGQPEALPVPDPNEALRIDGDTVQLLQGALDLGGIVKGWTVDLAVELLAEDFTGVLVNAGGDLRVAGSEPGRNGWLVGIDGIDGELAWEGELTGALATSTVLKRTWRVAGGRVAHHLIDPRTGLPATTARCQVSVAGSVTWEAECWAKAILLGGSPVAQQAGKAGYRVIPALDCPGSSMEQRTLLRSRQ